MKTLLIIITCSSLFVSQITLAQIVGGGGYNGNPSGNNPSSEKKSPFFFNIGMLKPGGQIAEPFVPKGTFDESFKGTNGLGAKTGFQLEMGNLFLIKGLNLPEKMDLGIKYSWLDFKVLPFSWDNEDLQAYSYSQTYVPFFLAGQKLGPAFYFSPIENFNIGCFYQLHPTAIISGEISINDYEFPPPSGYTEVYADINAANYFSFQLRNTIGLDVNFKGLYAGLEYDFGKFKISGDYTEDATYYQGNDYEYDYYYEPLESELKANFFMLKIGFMGKF